MAAEADGRVGVAIGGAPAPACPSPRGDVKVPLPGAVVFLDAMLANSPWNGGIGQLETNLEPPSSAHSGACYRRWSRKLEDTWLFPGPQGDPVYHLAAGRHE